MRVSIHAPARGATFYRYAMKATNRFQSTRPRGARRVSPNNGRKNQCFNPRAREGRDITPYGWSY